MSGWLDSYYSTHHCGFLLGHTAATCPGCGERLREPDGRSSRHHTQEAKAKRAARKIDKALKILRDAEREMKC